VLLALAALLLPATAQASVRTHATRTAHRRQACTIAPRGARRTRPAARRGASHVSGCRTRHSRRGIRVLRGRGPAGVAQQAVLGAIVAAPACDDGSAPGAQGCGDGSQPVNCPDGSALERQGSGPGVCRATPPAAAGGEFSCEADTPACSPATAQPNCEDGRDAVQTAAGSYTCADGSEPACEEAFTPVFREGRLVACEPGSEDEEEGEDS
jgi:hypothetical protein